MSVYQGGIDWGQVKAGGKAFAIMKATEGTGFTDPTFAANWSGAAAAGVIRGAYHFFHPSEDPTAQADHFATVMGALHDGDLPPMLDLEVTDGLGPAAVANATRTFLDALQSRTGRKQMIYTGFYFWRDQVGDPAGFNTDPLVIAAYVAGCPLVPDSWGKFTMWQYSDAGRVPGISGNVDLDVFNGTMADLRALAQVSTPYAAEFVAQSFPYASAPPVQIHAGDSIDVWIELKNVGAKAWDANTHLATTMPRDRASALAAPTWLAPDRPAGVTGSVPPGATFRFNFTILAPAQTGRYDEHFGVVEEAVAWFSDQGQGGPPDDQLEGIWQVEPASPHPALDGGTPDTSTPDAGASDAGEAASPDAGGPVVAPGPRAEGDAGLPPMTAGTGAQVIHPKGCTCASPAKPMTSWSLLLAAIALFGAWRARSHEDVPG